MVARPCEFESHPAHKADNPMDYLLFCCENLCMSKKCCTFAGHIVA